MPNASLNAMCINYNPLNIMRIVVQRIFEGWVKVGGATISHVKEGILVLVGLTHGDNKEVVEHMALKTLNMRLWEKDGKHWNASVMDINGEVLAVSQFTLYGIMKGNKPDFHGAMGAQQARELFHLFVSILKSKYQPDRIQTGEFQSLMQVGSIINGPVTIQYEKSPEEKPMKQKPHKEKKVEQKPAPKAEAYQKPQKGMMKEATQQTFEVEKMEVTQQTPSVQIRQVSQQTEKQ